jgi:hypothetical protein
MKLQGVQMPYARYEHALVALVKRSWQFGHDDLPPGFTPAEIKQRQAILDALRRSPVDIPDDLYDDLFTPLELRRQPPEPPDTTHPQGLRIAV